MPLTRLRALLHGSSRYSARMPEVYEQTFVSSRDLAERGRGRRPRYTPTRPWTTTPSVPGPERPGLHDTFSRAPRRCGADLAQRVLRRGRVRARDRAPNED